ncbi:DsbA family oxidoreductase [Dyella silvae]|uniref:DsbA family oxidoreductase n=1 Tax=Dyella silvae TaxID=2994424 RepID=UPI00226438D8|nr:DsbA family oxidoreductase [Dyella silvae]
MTLTITITSDFICPWCLVGERRLERALATLPDHVTVERHWRPFELNPDMPAAGMDRKAYRTIKFGSWERSQALDSQTVNAAKGDGVAFNYAAIAKTPNTLLAHRLMWLAGKEGRANALATAIFSAYFEQGRDIGDIGTLADVATETGMDRAKIVAFLAGDEGTAEVSEAEQAAHAQRTRGVPLFDIEGELISGAQPPEVFAAALQRAVARNESCATGFCTA